MFVIQNINDDPQQTLKECNNLCERILYKSLYENDDPFIHNNAVWRLGVTYYRQKDATMKINLNLAVNPF